MRPKPASWEEFEGSLIDRSGPMFDYKSIYGRDSFKSAFKYQELKNTSVPILLDGDTDAIAPEWSRSRISTVIHHVVVVLCYITCFLLFPITAWVAIKKLKSHERLVIFRLGRLLPAKGPGYTCIIPRVDQYRKIDTRTRAFNVPPQKVFTSDNAVIEVGADVYFHVVDAVRSVLHVQDLGQSVRVLAQLTLMNALSKIHLKRIQGDRANLGDEMKETMNDGVWKWGIEIDKFEMSHVTVVHNDPPMNAMSRLLGAAGQDGMTEDQRMIVNMMGAVMDTKQDSTTVDFTAMLSGDAPNTAIGAPVAGSSGAIPQAGPSKGSPSAPPPPAGLPSLPEIAVRILKDVLEPSLVSELQAIYKFNLTGQGGGVFYLDAKHGHGSTNVGEPSQSPDVTMTSSCEDFHRLICSDVSPLSLYMSGRLSIEGDLALAMKLDVLTDKIAKIMQPKASSSQNQNPQFAEGFVHHL